MYDTIIFAAGGTDFADFALSQVERLARALDAQVVLVSALDLPFLAAAVPGQPVEGLVHSERLEQLATELSTRGVRGVRSMVVNGPPANAILNVAAELGSDLIVMASHGRSGLARAFVGSVAEEVARTAEGISVLLVRPET